MAITATRPPMNCRDGRSDIAGMIAALPKTRIPETGTSSVRNTLTKAVIVVNPSPDCITTFNPNRRFPGVEPFGAR
jgi:hypothetical protein